MMNDTERAIRLRIFEIARHACRPLDFPKDAPVTDPVEELLRQFEVEQRRRLTELLAKVRAHSAPQPPAVRRPRYSKAAEAFKRHFPFDDQKVRRLCRKNAIDAATGHRFAQMIEGTWHVVEPNFGVWLRKIENGELAE